jgi:IS5 family transposase
MFLKFRYRLGYETLCREVVDSISWRRFCRIDIDGRVPHPTALMKITTRCGEATVAALTEALLAKAVEAKVVRTGKSAPTPPWCRPTLSTPPTRAYWPGP